VVADALSGKTHHTMSLMRTFRLEITRDIEKLGIELVLSSVMESYLSNLTVQPTLLDEIKGAQVDDPEMERIKVNISKRKALGFYEDDQGIIRFQGRVCVPQKSGLSAKILSEAHNTLYSIHPGGTNMYRDLRQTFQWSNMKLDIADYVNKCLTCQKIKAEYQRLTGELRPLEVATWKWDSILMAFVMGLPLTTSNRNAIWVIVDRLMKSAQFMPIHYSLTVDRWTQLYV